MNDSLFTNPLFQKERPWWMPLLSIGITLYGILFLDWHLFPVIFFFWWEVILMVGAALVRMFFSLDGGSFFNNFLQRIILLGGGTVLGMAFILFAVTFSLEGMNTGESWVGGFKSISLQTKILTGGAILGLLLHFFGNGRFRIAKPFNELISTFAYLLVMLGFLQVFTMHLIPNYPQLEQSKWIAVAVVVVKLGMDVLFMKLSPFVRVMED